MCRSVGHRVKTHKITPAVGNERGDIEIGKYFVLPRGQDNHLPPRTLLLEPQSDDDLNNAERNKNNHYHQKYAYLPEPVVFMSVASITSGRNNEEFLHLLFLHTNRESSVLTGELSKESAQFRFIRLLVGLISRVLLG